MLSSIFGIAIVALPAGIITAGYMTEIRKAEAQAKALAAAEERQELAALDEEERE